jgi:hypothetical protein
MSSEENADSIARTFSIKGDYEVLDLTNHAAASWYKEWGDATSLRYMIVSRQGVICIARPDSERKKALRFFWKILTLWEFVLFKKRIYRDYVEFLETEVPQLSISIKS